MKTVKAVHLACAFAVLAACTPPPEDHDHVVTVSGWLDAPEMSFSLPHEHVLVDFIGADSISAGRYNQDSAFNKILPYVLEFKNAGGKTIVECTPAYLGRDPALLKRLSEATGVQFITNTGYYGAVGEKYLPAHAFAESAEEIADRWIMEWNKGIDGTGIQPGFMKLSADKGPLTETQAKLIHAAAITHLETGLVIAVHNGDGAAAQQEVGILEENGVSAEAFIWVHAQNEKDSTIHKSMAKRGAWIEFDGLNENNIERYVSFLKYAKAEKFLDKVLISHDAGWYHVGETGGGEYRGYLTLINTLLPRLASEGFKESEVRMFTQDNPGRAFAIKTRQKD
jgi:predicted metal-dependent phosphotriesterase family hydrolase